MRPIRQKPHRLPDVAYHGRKCVSFTACEMARRRLLACDEVHGPMREMLAEAVGSFGCAVPMYCLMPDHLHVMVQGLEEASRPRLAMGRFKQKSGEWFAANRPDLEWQKDFHDRIVRGSEGPEAHARYIALNPVRAGLAEHVYAWPYSGSIGYEFERVIEDAWW